MSWSQPNASEQKVLGSVAIYFSLQLTANSFGKKYAGAGTGDVILGEKLLIFAKQILNFDPRWTRDRWNLDLKRYNTTDKEFVT